MKLYVPESILLAGEHCNYRGFDTNCDSPTSNTPSDNYPNTQIHKYSEHCNYRGFDTNCDSPTSKYHLWPTDKSFKKEKDPKNGQMTNVGWRYKKEKYMKR